MEVFDAASLQVKLAGLQQPVLVAAVEQVGGWEVETSRGSVVPDDWTAQAAARRLSDHLPA